MAGQQKARSREAWGRLRQLPSGRWQARYPGPDGVLYPAQTDAGQGLTFPTKTDARAWLAQRRADIIRGVWVSPAEAERRRAQAAEAELRQTITFAEYAERWLQRIQTEPGKGGRMRKPGTVMMYRGRVANYLLAPLGELPLRKIDTDVVRSLTADLVALPSVLRPGASHNGVAGDAVDVLKMILRAAVREGFLAAMPDVATPARRSVRHGLEHLPEDDVATPSQVDALYRAVPQPWSIAVLLAAWCQLRRGEALGLQRRDIVWNGDRSAATLFVRRQKSGSTGELTDPKSDKGVRSMAVPPIMIDRLRDHLDECVAGAPSAPVVPREERGVRHLSASQWNRIWSDHRDQVPGLPSGYRFHDLRHTGLTRFAQEGATLAELMRRGGHADVHVVLRYQKATMERDIELAARMSATVRAEQRRGLKRRRAVGGTGVVRTRPTRRASLG